MHRLPRTPTGLCLHVDTQPHTGQLEDGMTMGRGHTKGRFTGAHRLSVCARVVPRALRAGADHKTQEILQASWQDSRVKDHCRGMGPPATSPDSQGCRELVSLNFPPSAELGTAPRQVGSTNLGTLSRCLGNLRSSLQQGGSERYDAPQRLGMSGYRTQQNP